MSFPDLQTGRLRLCAMTADRLQPDKAGNYATLAQQLGCTVTSQWPPEHWEPHVFTFLEDQFAASPQQAAWNRYIVLRADPDVLVGTLGGFSVAPAEAEIGYSVLPAYEGQGIATEATLALLEHLRGTTGIISVRAHTFPHLLRSVRVMEKCGFQPDGAGAEEGTVRYRLQLR